MAKLRITILGCGASPGVPRLDGDWGACDPAEPRNRRSRCSILVERFAVDAPRPTRVLVDTSPDMRAQFLSLGGVDALDGVVYTHAHADHVHGIDDLRGYLHRHGKLVDVYTDDVTQARLDEAFAYCFASPPGSFYPPILRRIRIACDVPFVVDGPGGRVELTPFEQVHGDIITLGLKVGRAAYSCDVSKLPEAALAHLQDLDLWIVDALRNRPHPSHFTVAEAVEWSRRLKPRRTILTHMHSEIDYNALRLSLPDGVEPGYDGLSVDLADDGGS